MNPTTTLQYQVDTLHEKVRELQQLKDDYRADFERARDKLDRIRLMANDYSFVPSRLLFTVLDDGFES